jgi:hypothetical protein
VIHPLLDRLPRWGPVRAALSLAAVSVVPVAASLLIPPDLGDVRTGSDGVPIPWEPLTPGEAIVLAGVVLGIAAVVSGWLAGRAWRIRPWLGATVAIWVAWALAIGLLPLIAAILGLPLFTPVSCFTGCDAQLRSDEPFSGFIGGAAWLLGVLVIPYVAFFVGLALVAAVRHRWFVATVLAVIALHGTFNWFSVIVAGPPGTIPYACLAAGVTVWALWMRRNEAASSAVTTSRPGAGSVRR